MIYRLAIASAVAVGMTVTVPGATSAKSPANEPAQPSAQPQVVVVPGKTEGTISPLLFGANHRYGSNGDGIYDPGLDRVHPSFVEEAKAAGLTIVRYPSGTRANTFHFERAIGPQEQRIDQIDGDNGKVDSDRPPLSSAYGPDEHGAFVKSIGAKMNLMLNWGTGTAQEAADFVEYMTARQGTNPAGGRAWAEVRAANGHPKPHDVAFVEIGNEIGSGFQGYWAAVKEAGVPAGSLPMDEKCAGLAPPDDIDKRDIVEAICHYVHGGSMRIFDQRVNSLTDQRPEAAVSDGSANQTFYAKYPAVMPDDHMVYVDGELWRATNDLASAGAENVYQLTDPAAGQISFGDGAHGNIPPAGAVVTMTYTSGPHDGFDEFYRKIKEVNPKLAVCSGLSVRRARKPRLEPFLAEVGPMDCIIEHPSTAGTEVDYRDRPIEEFHDQWILEADKRGDDIAHIQHALAEAGRNIPVYATEYGAYPFPKEIGSDFGLSMDEGLYHADALRNFIELGVPVAEKHKMVGNTFGDSNEDGRISVLFSGPTPNYVSQPVAKVLALFSRMTGPKLVASTVRNNPFRTTFKGERMDTLTTVASKDAQGNIYLIVINRDRERDVTASVVPENFRGTGEAEVWTVTGPSYLSFNIPDAPNTVDLTKKTITVDPGHFDYTFGKHSVTAIKLSARNY